MPDEKPLFTSDRRPPSSSSWADDEDWVVGSRSNVEVVDGGLVPQRVVGSAEVPGSLIHDFENNSLNAQHTEWGTWLHSNSGNHVVDRDGEISGTYALRNDWDSTDINSHSRLRRASPTQSNFQYSIKLDNQSGNSNDDTEVQMWDNTQTGLKGGGRLDWRQNGNLVWRPQDGTGETILQSWSADSIYNVILFIDYEVGQVDIEINGTLYENLGWQAGAVDTIRLQNQHNTSGTAGSMYIDGIYEG